MANRKLGVKSNHRKAMLRGMTTFLLEKGQIETTVTRAKELRATTEKMITLAKTDSLHNKRQAMKENKFFAETFRMEEYGIFSGYGTTVYI